MQEKINLVQYLYINNTLTTTKDFLSVHPECFKKVFTIIFSVPKLQKIHTEHRIFVV